MHLEKGCRVGAMKKQHVLVLGAGGNVSRHSIPKLVAAGHSVTALVRNPDHVRQLVDEGATAIVRDLTTISTEDWARLLSPFDVVVWSAGAGGGSAELTYAVDRDAAMAMIDALERKFPGNYGLSMSGDLGYHDEVPFDVEHLPDMSRYQLTVAINANYEQLRPIPYLHDTLRGEWELIGWNTEPDGSGTMHRPGDRFHVPLGVTHLYAQFRPTRT